MPEIVLHRRGATGALAHIRTKSRTPSKAVATRHVSHASKCGATMSMNSRAEMILVFFQCLGKCFRLPVTR